MWYLHVQTVCWAKWCVTTWNYDRKFKTVNIVSLWTCCFNRWQTQLVDKRQVKARCRNNTWTTIILQNDLQTKDKPSWTHYTFHHEPTTHFWGAFLVNQGTLSDSRKQNCKTQAPCIQNDCKTPIPSCRFVPNTVLLHTSCVSRSSFLPIFVSLIGKTNRFQNGKKKQRGVLLFFTNCHGSLTNHHPLALIIPWIRPAISIGDYPCSNFFSEALELGQTSNRWVEADALRSRLRLIFFQGETHGKKETTKLPNWENPVYMYIYIYVYVRML